MKTIQINKNTLDIILIPVGLDSTPRPWLYTKKVESIPTIQRGQRLQWIPDDAEKPAGPGSLQVVDVPVPTPPLRDRLRKKEEGITPEILASMPFERVAYWLERDRPDIAKIVIEQTNVSGHPKAVQDAKAALLAEFEL